MSKATSTTIQCPGTLVYADAKGTRHQLKTGDSTKGLPQPLVKELKALGYLAEQPVDEQAQDDDDPEGGGEGAGSGKEPNPPGDE